MKLGKLTAALICVSEKAANIARAIRSEHTLFKLLVQEKTGTQKNDRFVQDFKTLADVLVQETVKYDLEKQFPGIIGHVYGEESNQFTNACGESVTVEVKDSSEKTADLLVRVLDGNNEAAGILAGLVHHDTDTATSEGLDGNEIDLQTDEIGIWIDPIDSTAQYINGSDGHLSSCGVYEDGLRCVVVLIGVYLRTTGQPIAGVINQPFSTYSVEEKRWIGRTVWGISYKDVSISSINSQQPNSQKQTADYTPCIVMSNSESPHMKATLSKDCRLCFAAGAGYKILSVLDGIVDAYVLSQGSTYKWDTCGPQALLQCLGGSLVDFKKACDSVDICASDMVKSCAVRYHEPDDSDALPAHMWSNSGGIIAFRDTKVLESIISSLK